jgi:hypothetical protein
MAPEAPDDQAGHSTTQERDPAMAEISVHVTNLERDIANMKGTMIFFLNGRNL